MLAGAEEGNEEYNYRVVRDNKRKDQSLYSSRTTVDNRRVVQSPKAGLAKRQRVDDRRAVIVRSKVERPLTLPSSIFSKLTNFFVRVQGLLSAKAVRTACAVIALGLTYVCAACFCISVFLYFCDATCNGVGSGAALLCHS